MKRNSFEVKRSVSFGPNKVAFFNKKDAPTKLVSFINVFNINMIITLMNINM